MTTFVLLSTNATPTATVGGLISDTANLEVIAPGPHPNPTGTITFRLFGPNNATCADPPIFVDIKPVNGFGAYLSASFITSAPGTYRWVASYSGDANYISASTACNDDDETSVVAKAQPSIVTSTTPTTTTVEGLVADTATLSGGFNPTGTITFRVFGPNDATCTEPPIFEDTRPLNQGGATSVFNATIPGTYIWVATYNGDNNNEAASNPCGEISETFRVFQEPTLTTQVSQEVVLPGEPVTDTATLSGGFSPTGTITFTLFGPNNATCTGTPIFQSVVAVNGDGNYISTSFIPITQGTYRWIATYSGDANNTAVSTACNDPNEDFLVVCYLSGTLILTPDGGIPIEKLRIGDDVLSLSINKLAKRKIKWIGTLTPKVLNGKSYPIKISKSALGNNLPNRDLYVSPDHGIFIENRLILAKLLVNGKSVYQDKTIKKVKYYHIELEEHSIIVAEGIYAESYLDANNRGTFDNSKEAEENLVSKRCAKYIRTHEKAEPYLRKLNKSVTEYFVEK